MLFINKNVLYIRYIIVGHDQYNNNINMMYYLLYCNYKETHLKNDITYTL